MLDKTSLFKESEKAILVGVALKDQKDHLVHDYLDELAFLASTAGAETVRTFIQKLSHPDSKTYIGKGKLEEIRDYAQGKDIRVLIFDDELTGAQISNIEKATNIKTIDRSDLILDIFARRAKTAQAKAQVELAQYQYILPRLRGMWKHLERLGGGIGTRGPGESEIETTVVSSGKK
jgi:GTP-binding protein HflX